MKKLLVVPFLFVSLSLLAQEKIAIRIIDFKKQQNQALNFIGDRTETLTLSGLLLQAYTQGTIGGRHILTDTSFSEKNKSSILNIDSTKIFLIESWQYQSENHRSFVVFIHRCLESIEKAQHSFIKIRFIIR